MLVLFMTLASLSISGNVALIYALVSKKKKMTTDARLLLSELASGSAIIKVDVLDSAGLFYRSPKG